jgi:hypothetical protein
MNSILLMCITVFVTQVIFIWARTWNVKCIAANDMKGVLLSGSVVHIAWLVSITLGVVSFKEILMDFQWQYLPVIFFSLTGGLLGSYFGLKEKKKYRKPKLESKTRTMLIGLLTFWKS